MLESSLHAQCTLAYMHGFIHLHRHTHHIELSNMIQMMPQTLQTVTKWLSYEPVHTRIYCACILACLHGFINLHRHTHRVKLSIMIPMIPQNPLTVTKWLSYELGHTRIKHACTLVCVHGLIHLH